MLNNYIKISVRHLWQNKLYSFINVVGLAIAITCVLLAVLYIKEERGYDRFHENKENLYRILTSRTDDKGARGTVAGTGQPQGPAFKEAVPEIVDYARVLGGDIKGDVIANNKTLNLQILFADESFFNLFSFSLLRGDKTTALKDVSAVVITETVALKFFNSIDVVGKRIDMDADPSADKLGRPSMITAVVKDLPKNSSIRFDVLMPMRYMQLSFTDTAWLNQYLGTFVLLRPGSDLNKVSRKFDQVFASHAKFQLEETKKLYNYDPKISYSLQNVADMHLNPRLTGSWREGGIVNESNPIFSWLFLGIALFILFMATVNFINISIAGSLKRAKEVGVRKITGGSKKQIIFQFLFESAIVCLAAFVVAAFLTSISLPLFNELVKKQLVFSESIDLQLLIWFAGILLLIILLTGFYPAYMLSAFKPKEVLYNKQKLSGRNLFGHSLVILQFSLAVFFIISTIIYYRQMNFVRTKDLGYDPYQVVRTHIRGNREYKAVQEILRNELSKEPAIKHLSFGGYGQVDAVKLGDKKLDAVHEVIDEYRLPVMQIKLKAGRNISSAIPPDKHHAVIVNEAFVKAAGLESPVGSQLYTSDRFDKELKTIVGVIEDYHSGSLHEPIKPMVMLLCDWASDGIWIRIEKQNQQRALKAIEAAYKKAMPTALYEYKFLDELNAQAYEQEQRWQKIIGIAAVLSVVICCLGLFGLAHLAAQRRVKEIGIRKVLGATVAGIASLLTKDFLKLVLISLLVASPVAWWVMNNWLQDFAYRINIGWWMFVLAGLIAIVIAMITVGFHAVRTAIANPVKSLRAE
ncbi:ABC transporter permease [Terrimonas pollutisoli]|uniref:ABC transporter permease n=1 Tax=Terrimonas pollutisoli TaxID=3034147 RepID=UPI0023ED4A05|nr:ABC transporter permease [Terrimonas sp. H1YJ31]